MPNAVNKIPNDFTLMTACEESVEKLKKNDPRRVKGMKAKAVPLYHGGQSVCGICGEKSRTYPNKKALKMWDRLHLKGKHPDYL
tara:strand:+ start:69 stop:320 length:252 start_codon:yes stop_codon:yes gene_type:complete